MSKVTYKVDLDYEAYLFDPNYNESDSRYEKIIREFEYVYFFINKEESSLKNFKKYSSTYLESLKNLNFVIPHFTPDETKFDYWWGKRIDLELERKLNSKLTSAEFASSNDLGFFDGKIVENVDDVRSFVKDKKYNKWILKSPFGFSGVGHQIFDRSFLPLVKFNHPYLLEPVHDRIVDLGITFEIVEAKITRMFIVINFNNKMGSFKGGMGAKNNDLMINYLKQNFSFDLKPHLDKYKKICDYYLFLGATSNIQIDSFIYKEDEELKLYPLVEINYRKTMGLVIQSLTDHFECDLLEWRVTHTSEYENKLDWTKISPESNKFNSYFKTYIFDKDL